MTPLELLENKAKLTAPFVIEWLKKSLMDEVSEKVKAQIDKAIYYLKNKKISIEEYTQWQNECINPKSDFCDVNIYKDIYKEKENIIYIFHAAGNALALYHKPYCTHRPFKNIEDDNSYFIPWESVLSWGMKAYKDKNSSDFNTFMVLYEHGAERSDWDLDNWILDKGK